MLHSDGVQSTCSNEYSSGAYNTLHASCLIGVFWQCAEYLFPAAALLARINSKRGTFSVAALPQRDLYLALNARCSTKASRQVSALMSS